MPMKLVAGMDVGNVHFENRPFESLECIENGNGCKRVARRIDDDRVGILAR